ncbi:MAG: DUF4139 domain-containing protein [Vicingaceae bacterium]|nr:DUF4139 domain-containing protein [Vicingaceae bacterium]
MKKLISTIMLVVIANMAFTATRTTVNSKIKNVTVFLNGAQIFRKASVNLKKGVTEIVFDSISSSINANSIQVKGKGNYTILETKYKYFQPTSSTIPPAIPKNILDKIQHTQDSLDFVNFDLEEVKYKKDVLELEKQLLVGNKSMKSDSLALLKDAMSFFRAKYNDINATLIKVKKQEYQLNKTKNRLQTRLNKINTNNAQKYKAKPSYPRYQIVVTVSANDPTPGVLDVNYLVANASWTPKYDLRASGVNEPIELTYKANVYQNSGENWDNVKLKLSTNNPNKSKVKPVLPIWYLNYYSPNYGYNNRKSKSGMAIIQRSTEAAKSLDDYSEKEEELPIATTSAYYASMNENLTNIEFDLGIAYSIPSDGQNHLVAVKNEKLDAKYQYYMVPKLDKDAFLVADVRGFEGLSLLPASANIYFEGTFIGETMLNPDVMGDSLALTLGRDERISIRRKLVKEEKKDKFLADKQLKYFTYELEVKNHRPNNVDIIIEDHIPVPNNEDIKVGLLSYGKADYIEKTGMLSWKFTLPSKQNKKMEFKYSVEYNKDKQIALK